VSLRASRFASLVVLLSIAEPVAAEAQQAGKLWQIGFLGPGTPTAWKSGIEALQRGLQDHGYVEGRNVRIEYRWAENRYDRLPELAVELVRLKPDVIITAGTPSTLALKRATSAIPIVMSIIGNPVENGTVASLGRPGGNITGSSFFSDEITAKRLEILKTGYPALARFGFLTNQQCQDGEGFGPRDPGIAAGTSGPHHRVKVAVRLPPNNRLERSGATPAAQPERSA
jgi:putative ABC transport system substrate-binding protein